MSKVIENTLQEAAVLRGSCACGRISYTTTCSPSAGTFCYCAQCRKISGGSSLAFLAFPQNSMTWSKEPEIYRHSDIARRGFCATCGSSLYMQYFATPESIGVTYGSIDECKEPIPPPKEHIFLKEKASWSMLPNDGKDRYEALDPPFAKKLVEWERAQEEKAQK